MTHFHLHVIFCFLTIYSLGCPPGQGPFGDPMTNETLECHPMRQHSCPPGFGCYYSSIFDRHQCCGVNQGKTVNSSPYLTVMLFIIGCPVNSAAYSQPNADKPLTCGSLGCPMGFFCYKMPEETEGTCCSEDPVVSEWFLLSL